jgi:peroxiredoxin
MAGDWQGRPFPRFELAALDGRRWDETDLRGTRAVVFCFASWCTCREQLPVWQRWWDERDRAFTMLGVALDATGAERVAPIIAEREVEFPVLLDPAGALAAALRFGVVPTGVFVDDGAIAYRHTDDFDAGDPRVRSALDAFLRGEAVPAADREERMRPEALARFADGVAAHGRGDEAAALALWREALDIDPANFVIRSQIWALEHPERFWPTVDREWQEQQLLREGYAGALP